MNIEKIKEIVNADLPDEWKRRGVIAVLADDKNVIADVLSILDHERDQSKELITDMNVLLSKADTALTTPKLNKDNFIQGEIAQFYTKWSKRVFHVFKSV